MCDQKDGYIWIASMTEIELVVRLWILKDGYIFTY